MNSIKYGGLWEMTRHAKAVTFIGAGGKTTCVKQLSAEIQAAGYPVVVSTTTKVFPDPTFFRWQSTDFPPEETVEYPCFWFGGVEKDTGKWYGPSLTAVDRAIFDASDRGIRGGTGKRSWVIEGDGAKGKRLKLWNALEPQIPQSSECVVLVVDGSLWGRRLEADDVHRPERFPELIGEIFYHESFWRYLANSPVFWPQYGQMSWVVFLNQSSVNTNKMLEAMWRFRPGIEGINESMKKPAHLRLAAGQAKEGIIQWCDWW
ncbi:MAG: selenium cofactor biosynthesis protein YqeC [Desulfitobacteriaceae bacterium]|nr:selenium cofactor biosynthesis protein YqeC [Desulfitobacteriaceae bacterium]MDI6913703.1 selenium cofactor biosynthesis protein YqeC [Desulfitobacteriaceae bacterium]